MGIKNRATDVVAIGFVCYFVCCLLASLAGFAWWFDAELREVKGCYLIAIVPIPIIGGGVFKDVDCLRARVGGDGLGCRYSVIDVIECELELCHCVCVFGFFTPL